MAEVRSQPRNRVGALGRLAAIAAGSAVLLFFDPVAVATTWGGVIEGVEPGDRVVLLLDGGDLFLRADGGWAAVGSLPDGGARLYPTTAPDGYYVRGADGGWSSLRLLPDGGQLLTPGEKPRGY